jgi:ATP-dependent helicase/nuclease subunit A
MSLMTASQQAALTARGNVLVVAGAGTGKTHTLIERCCALLLEENCSLDEILMVTFTDAAAAEMRKRIRARLADKASETGDARHSRHIEEQLALLDTAYISTLHSFCLRLVREHFHDERLRLDPEFVVLGEEQIHQLRNDTLDAMLEAHYGGASEEARAFQRLVTEQAGGMEARVRDLIWQLHVYSRSLAAPDEWLDRQLALFGETEPIQWREWLLDGFAEWREHWLRELERFAGTQNVADCLSALRAVKGKPAVEEIAGALRKIQEACDCKWPRGAVGAVRDEIEEFFDDARFLQSLLPLANGEDPLAQDWQWSRGHMRALLRLAGEFGERFDDAKREAGGVDFADLEQFALRLLWDAQSAGPTPLAREWQARLKFVFVDEYQDINDAQDTILRALSREGAQANRFLVGDVKQSIYRFRLANPKIFQAYKKLWERREARGEGNSPSQTIPLSDNFRSRESLLDFVNSFFALFMREEIGGVAYDADASLKFGAPKEREPFSRKADASPHVEIHLRTKTKEDPAENNGSGENDFADLDATEKEARLVALQMKKLQRDKLKIWDSEEKLFRPVEWRDMVVLLRSPRNKAEIYAREFNRAAVPLQAKRDGFYSTTEVSDLLSLLQLLDNPMQDLPLLAVLRSPLVGLSVDELAAIRAGQRDDRFWTAVLRFGAMRTKLSGDAGKIAIAAQPKLKAFLTLFDSWRRHAREGSLSDCARGILDQTHYESLVLAQERGEERLANVNRLLRLMRQFDPYQRQGLLRFLRFVEAQRDAEAEEEPASPTMADAVRLLSIHQSKGLEFPVVAVANVGKLFNVADLHADILIDAEFGLCPRVAPPNVNARYPSLPYWLARRRHKKELIGEELRLLYVAMTRARDRLLLAGSVSEKQFETHWQTDREITATSLLQARSYADWLAAWFAKNCAIAESATQGESALCRWQIHDDRSLVDGEAGARGADGKQSVHLTAAQSEILSQKLSAQYAFAKATEEPAKTSVSVLRRRAMELFENEETVSRSTVYSPRSTVKRRAGVSKAKRSAAEVGTAYHRFLESISFERVGAVEELRVEAERMAGEGVLSAEEAGWLDFDLVLDFWQSEFGKKILANAEHVRRELAFTARFSPGELAEFSQPDSSGGPVEAQEFVIVQGVADLAVLLPKEIWLLDFKTDEVGADGLVEKIETYRPQLKLYAQALERIYNRPVTDCRLHFLACGKTAVLTDETLLGEG